MSVGSVAIVGVGAGALALAEELARCEGIEGVTVYGRQPSVPEHTVFARELATYVYGLTPFDRATAAVVVAVPDEVVPELAHAVAAQGPAPDGCAAFHLSGSLPTEALAPLHVRGYELGAFHPLGAPARPSENVFRVGGAHVALTGSAAAVSVGRRLASELGASAIEVPAGRRPLVAAATALASGYLGPLLGLSLRLMERAGIASDEAVPALGSVVRLTLDQIESEGVGASGHPVVEGDVEAVSLHIRALDPEDQRLYALLALEILRLEGERVDGQTREAMVELLGRWGFVETTSVS